MRVNNDNEADEFPQSSALDDSDDDSKEILPSNVSTENEIRQISNLARILFIFVIVVVAPLFFLLKFMHPNDSDSEDYIFAHSDFLRSKYELAAKSIKDKYYEQIDKMPITLNKLSDKLLVGIIVTNSTNFLTRQMVRAHQIKPYNETFDVTWRFFLPRLSSNLYVEAIKAENETYGDIIVLESVISDSLSPSFFTLEMFKYIERHMGPYKYVGKLDTQTVLNVKDFWDLYFTQTIQNLNYSIISSYIKSSEGVNWLRGGFQAFSWKLMLNLNRLYTYVNITSSHEIIQIPLYLHHANINYTEVVFTSETNLRWPIKTTPKNFLSLYNLKNETHYLLIANCFNISGVNTYYIDFMDSKNWNSAVM